VLEKPFVGHVVENSPAQKLGLKEGDLFLEINGKKVNTWKDFENVVLESVLKKNWNVVVLRNGQVLRLSGSVELSKAHSFGVEPYIKPIIGKLLPKSPAEQVGIKEGDEILEINGKKVKSWYDAVALIRSTKGDVIKLKLQRNGQIFEKLVVPVVDKKTGVPLLGVSPRIEFISVKEPLGEAVLEGFKKTQDIAVLSVKALWGLVTGGLSLKTLGGPIAIAQLAGESAQQGLIAFLGMMAFISVQLAVFNLIPLPVLDGGLILLFLIESVRRKPLSQKFKENWQKVGFAIIITLSAFVILNDILRLITGSGV
jgi:regulator of sigma E protease